jgi:hypothetical protein
VEEDEELAPYRAMWESDENWYINEDCYHTVSLKLVFGESGPTIREMIAIRRVIEEFQGLPPHTVKARLAGLTEWDLGYHSSIGGNRLYWDIVQSDLNVLRENSSQIFYVPVLHQNGQAIEHPIQDQALAKRVAEKMKAAGRPVSGSEYC